MAPSRKKAKASKPAASTSAGTAAKPRKKAVRKSELDLLQEFDVKWGVPPEKERELDADTDAAKKRKREEEEETDADEVQVVEVRDVGPKMSARQQARIDKENTAAKAKKAGKVAAKPKPKAKPAKRPNKIHITEADDSESEEEFPPVDELVAREQALVAREQALVAREQALVAREQALVARKQRKGNQNQMEVIEEEEEAEGDVDDGNATDADIESLIHGKFNEAARSVVGPKKQKPKPKPKSNKPKVNNKKAKPANLPNGTLAGPDRRPPPAFNMFEPQHGVEMWYSDDLSRYVGRRVLNLDERLRQWEGRYHSECPDLDFLTEYGRYGATVANNAKAKTDPNKTPAEKAFDADMHYFDTLGRLAGLWAEELETGKSTSEEYAAASAELATQLAASKQAWRDVVASQQNWNVDTGSLQPGASIRLVKKQKLLAGDHGPRKDLRCPDELQQQSANHDLDTTPGDRSFARVVALARKFGTKQEKVRANEATHYRMTHTYGHPFSDNNHAPLAHLQAFEPLCRRVERYRSSIPGPPGGYGGIPEEGERENLKLHYEAFERLGDKFRMGERRERRVKTGLERTRPVLRTVGGVMINDDRSTPDSNREEEEEEEGEEVHSPLVSEGEGEDDEQDTE